VKGDYIICMCSVEHNKICEEIILKMGIMSQQIPRCMKGYYYGGGTELGLESVWV